MIDPGESEPAEVCSLSLTLGILLGKLDAELLCRSRESELLDRVTRVLVGTRISVRMWRLLRKFWGCLVGASGGERVSAFCLKAR